MQQKDLLKETYEKVTGKGYSDRQWRRIKSEYLKGQVTLSTVKVHARLRKVNGRRNLTLTHVERVKGFDQFANCLDGAVTGQDIYDAFKFLNPAPSSATIRRWGLQIGLPLIKTQWYTPEEAQLWIRYVGDHVRFKFPESAVKRKRGA